MRARGAWYDEFFTLYVASPRFGWGEALRDHWLADNHPPLFYALARATAWLGDTVPPRRLVNLVLTVPAVAGFALLARHRPDWRGVIALFAIALVAAPTAVFYGAELRSNYLAFLSSALAVLALAALAGPDSPRPSPRGTALLLLALAIAFATHLAATVLTGGVAVAFVLVRIVRRDLRGALWLTGVCALASLPLLLSLAVQMGRIEANTRTFWIPAGFTAARWAIEHQVMQNLLANPVLTLGGGLGLVLLARGNRSRLVTVLVLIAGLGIGTVALLGLHMWRPIVINRYLVAMGPPMLLVLTIGFEALLIRLRPAAVRTGLVLLLGGATMLALWSGWQRILAEPSFMGTGRAIAALVRACPQTLVHADMHWNEPVMDLPPADNRAVMPMAYAITARTLGFALEPQGSRRLSATCPTVFWTEHVADLSINEEQLAKSLRARGYAVRSLALKRTGRGWIAVSNPGLSKP